MTASPLGGLSIFSDSASYCIRRFFFPGIGIIQRCKGILKKKKP